MAVVKAVAYALAHAPDLVRYGSKPSRQLRTDPDLERRLKARLRTYGEAVAYAPNQTYIGNLTPEQLTALPRPWFTELCAGASPEGRLGRTIDQTELYRRMKKADQFE